MNPYQLLLLRMTTTCSCCWWTLCCFLVCNSVFLTTASIVKRNSESHGDDFRGSIFTNAPFSWTTNSPLEKNGGAAAGGGPKINVSIEDRNAFCRDKKLLSMYVIECQSPIDCTKKIPCVLNATKANGCLTSSGQRKDKLYPAKSCASSSSSWISPQATSSRECLVFNLDSDFVTNGVKGGMYICVTSDHRMTLDYIYIGLRPVGFKKSSHILLSVLQGSDMFHQNGNDSLQIFDNELVSPECYLSRFNFYEPPASSSPIMGLLHDGTTFNIDPQLIVREHDADKSKTRWQFTVKKFRFSKSMAGFVCRGQIYKSLRKGEEARLKIRVIDLPTSSSSLMLSVKTEGGHPILVHRNQSLGCNLNSVASSEELSVAKEIFHDELTMYNLELTADGHGSGGGRHLITSMPSFMRFQKLAEDYAGGFTCTPIESVRPTSHLQINFHYFVHIDEPKPPKIDMTRESPTRRIDDDDIGDGSSLGDLSQSLHCHYTGQPEPYILWLRNGKIFQYSMGEWVDDHYEASLTLPLLDPEVDGYPNFTCQAVNYLGNDSRHFFVEEKPVIDQSHLSDGDTIEDQEGNVTMVTIRGGNLNLSCIYNGGPRTTIEWLHEGKKILESFHTRDEKCRARYTKSVLKLTARGHELEGQRLTGHYTCVVKNSLGNDSRHFVVQYHPQNESISNASAAALAPSRETKMTPVSSVAEEVKCAHDNGRHGGDQHLVTTLCIVMVISLLAIVVLTVTIVHLWRRNKLLETSHKFIGRVGYDRIKLIAAAAGAPEDPSSSILGHDHDHRHDGTEQL